MYPTASHTGRVLHAPDVGLRRACAAPARPESSVRRAEARGGRGPEPRGGGGGGGGGARGDGRPDANRAEQMAVDYTLRRHARQISGDGSGGVLVEADADDQTLVRARPVPRSFVRSPPPPGRLATARAPGPPPEPPPWAGR